MSIYWTTISTTFGRTRGSLTGLFEKWGALAGELSPFLDPRLRGWGALAGQAEILGRSPPPLPFGTRVPDCSLARELVTAFFAGRGLLVSSSELSSLKVLLLLIVSISISFSSLLTSFEAVDCIVPRGIPFIQYLWTIEAIIIIRKYHIHCQMPSLFNRKLTQEHRSADHHHVNIRTVHNKRMVTTMRFTKNSSSFNSMYNYLKPIHM